MAERSKSPDERWNRRLWPAGRSKTHEALERAHNRAEHRRNGNGAAYEASSPEDTLEPLHGYDLDVMPRGV